MARRKRQGDLEATGQFPGKAIAPFAPSEGEILRELWRLNGGTIREVTDALSERLGWTFQTVSTFMERLTEKGWVEVSERLRYRERKFEVTATKEEAIGWLTVRFLGLWGTDREGLQAVKKAVDERELELGDELSRRSD